MCKVSICIPAYKNPTGVGRLLDSIKVQKFIDYEVIVTDDSPDDSVRLAAEAAGIAGLRYFKNAERKGATGNWNESLRYANGEYIKIMHHDDWFTDENSLQAFVDMLDDHPEADLAFCGTWQITLNADGQKTGEAFVRCISDEQLKMITEDYRDLYIGDYIGAPTATICRRNTPLYEERLTWIVDVEYYMRILQNNPRLVCSREPLISIGVSENQLTERCRTDGPLNIFEYGFVMQEFDLSKEERYRRKIIEIALKYKQPYAAIAKFGIPRAEYRQMAAAKRRRDFVFYLGVAKRKLFGRSTG